MKNTQKALLFVLCGVLVLALSCVGGPASSGGPPVLAVGEWMVYNDHSDGGSSTASFTVADEVIDGETKSVITVRGNVTNQFEYGFAGWGLDADEATMEAFKTASAISFKILGDGKRYSVKFKVSNVRDHCYHEFAFTTEAGVAMTVEVPIRFFMQPSWGTPVRLNQSLVTGIEWQTHESWRPDSFQIKMWDFMVHP
jgi:hypothetical protein